MNSMRWPLLFMLLSCLGCDAQAPKQNTKPLFVAENFDAINALVRNDSLANTLYSEVVGTTYPLKELSKAAIAERSLSGVREMVQQALQHAFLYRVTASSTHLAEASAYLDAICAPKDWNPDHFLDVAETTFGVSVALHWLGNSVDQELKQKVRNTLQTHAFDTFLKYASVEEGRFWTRGENNWTVVCNSALYVGSVLHPDVNGSGEVRRMAYENLQKGLKLYAPDGSWSEGPMYWSYATNYAAFAIEAEKWSTGKPSVLKNAEGLDKTASTYLSLIGPSGLTFNYGDANKEGINIAPGLLLLAKEFGQSDEANAYLTIIQDKSDKMAKDIDHRFAVFHLLWFPENFRRTSVIADSHLKLIRGSFDIAVMNTESGSSKNLYLAMKGGDASQPHQHRDAGSFVLDLGDVRFFSDLGREKTNIKTKNGKSIDKRSVYRVSSASHNVIRVGNGEQKEIRTTPMVIDTDARSATLDVSNCYEGCTSVIRRVSMENSSILMEDMVQGCVDSLFWQGMTKARVTVSGNRIHLALRKRKLTIEVLEPANVVIRVVEPKPFRSAESKNTGYGQVVIGRPANSGTLKIRFSPD